MSIIHGDVREAITTDAPTYGHSATGYGPKVPLRYMVRLTDDAPNARWRRVYCSIYGNIGSLYVVRGGTDVHLSDTDLQVALGRP